MEEESGAASGLTWNDLQPVGYTRPRLTMACEGGVTLGMTGCGYRGKLDGGLSESV